MKITVRNTDFFCRKPLSETYEKLKGKVKEEFVEGEWEATYDGDLYELIRFILENVYYQVIVESRIYDDYIE